MEGEREKRLKAVAAQLADIVIFLETEEITLAAAYASSALAALPLDSEFRRRLPSESFFEDEFIAKSDSE